MYSAMFREVSGYDFGEVVRIVFSGSSGDVQKMTIRPLQLKGKIFLQCEKNIGNKVFHINIEPNKFQEIVGGIALSNQFSEVNIFLTDKNITYHVTHKRQSRKVTLLEKKLEVKLSHDRKKNYILSEGMEIPALVDLGIFDASFHIIKSKNDKFAQINKFIEIISDSLKTFSDNELTIIDFGCGKSYLTFIVYYYFTFIRNIKTKIIGYDLKSEVIKECQSIASRYGYSGIEFFEGDISRMELYAGNVDMIITLHACDIATDHALWYAIKNSIHYIFSVPCCQQEVNSQIKFKNEYSLFARHGLYQERFSAIFTDCIRCEALKNFGYEVDVVEFVDFSNTPKNAMIRAELKRPPLDKKCTDLNELVNSFNVSQTLLTLINKEDSERSA